MQVLRSCLEGQNEGEIKPSGKKSFWVSSWLHVHTYRFSCLPCSHMHVHTHTLTHMHTLRPLCKQFGLSAGGQRVGPLGHLPGSHGVRALRSRRAGDQEGISLEVEAWPEPEQQLPLEGRTFAVHCPSRRPWRPCSGYPGHLTLLVLGERSMQLPKDPQQEARYQEAQACFLSPSAWKWTGQARWESGSLSLLPPFPQKAGSTCSSQFSHPVRPTLSH